MKRVIWLASGDKYDHIQIQLLGILIKAPKDTHIIIHYIITKINSYG